MEDVKNCSIRFVKEIVLFFDKERFSYIINCVEVVLNLKFMHFSIYDNSLN